MLDILKELKSAVHETICDYQDGIEAVIYSTIRDNFPYITDDTDSAFYYKVPNDNTLDTMLSVFQFMEAVDNCKQAIQDNLTCIDAYCKVRTIIPIDYHNIEFLINVDNISMCIPIFNKCNN